MLPIIFGTSSLGNLYEELPFHQKLAIVKACVESSNGGITFFDSAGKYGAGLSLEILGACLETLQVPPEKVLISNKLGWYSIPILGEVQQFEPGVWVNLTNDAEQRISYAGILECFEQGNEFLGNYRAQMVSIHDPDDFIDAAINNDEKAHRYLLVLEAFKALKELKEKGIVQSVGVGAKNWKIIQKIAQDVDLDWIMVANSLTIHSHDQELIAFVANMALKNIQVFNAAIFNGGFLTGGDYYNYALVDPKTEKGASLFQWRDAFFALCNKFNILPAEACYYFSSRIKGVKAIALNTYLPEQVKSNTEMITKIIPDTFWLALVEQKLADKSLLKILEIL
jgi:D-threo-aldose 1-dehydrogenase